MRDVRGGGRLWSGEEYPMTVRAIAAFGAALGLALPLAALVLPSSAALAQYRDYPPAAREYPPQPYPGPNAADEDDETPGANPPPTYRSAPPPRSYGPGPGPYSQDSYPPPGVRYERSAPPPGTRDYSAVPADEEEGPYGPPGRPYGAPPPAGPYGPPQYGPRPYDPPPAGQTDMRPPGAIGPGQQSDPRSGPNEQAVRGPQALSPEQYSSLPPEDRPELSAPQELPAHLRRQLVTYPTREPAGTLVIDTPNTYLYLVLGNGKAMRYGIGVGREGFTWTGVERVSRMAEWPDWHPPKEMIERQPYLPRFMAGGNGNPLGARALYLGKTLYRIHGTNQPSTIGTFVSSGCVRLVNADIEDLYQRVQVGTRVVVLPGGTPPAPTAQNTR
jgi:lipoprotein-anchoring transpeptidase ErfK/SrfK